MANTYTLIASTTVGSGGTSSIDFTVISASYTDLKLVMSLRSDQTQIYGSAFISFNSSTSNFSNRFLYANGSVAGSGILATANGIADNVGASATASTFSNSEIYIANYTSSNYKSFYNDSVGENNATTAFAEMWANLWSNTATISSISITPASGNKWVQYSTAYLYGIKNS